jgi:hypothetical protein
MIIKLLVLAISILGGLVLALPCVRWAEREGRLW